MAEKEPKTNHLESVFKDWKPEHVDFFYQEKEKQHQKDKAEREKLLEAARLEAKSLIKDAKNKSNKIIFDAKVYALEIKKEAKEKLELEKKELKAKEEAIELKETRKRKIYRNTVIIGTLVFITASLSLHISSNIFFGHLCFLFAALAAITIAIFLSFMFEKLKTTLIATFLIVVFLIINGTLLPKEFLYDLLGIEKSEDKPSEAAPLSKIKFKVIEEKSKPAGL
jgi:hypothetical protein